MWKRGDRSSALDRAQALLSARRDSRGDAESVQGSAAVTPVHTGVVRSRAAPSNTHILLSDLSDLSSVSSASEHGADTEAAAAGRTQEGEGGFTKDLRPQSSLGGGGQIRNRFLKKAPPPPTNNSQSPVRKSQMQHPEPRNVSSSLRGSQTAALSRLAQIESRIRSRQQTTQWAKPAKDQTSDVGIQIQPPPAAQSPDASGQLSAQSSSDHSLKGNRFFKSNTAPAARAPQSPDVGVRFRSRAADAVVPSLGLETNSGRAVSGVCLESDEEDMRKLLGDSLNSVDNSFLIPGRPADKVSNKSSQKVQPTPPHTAAPPRSPTSPSRRSSPFRFTGPTQAHFSPSALSPSPPPPLAPSLSPPGRLNFTHGPSSPQRSLSSLSGCGEVLSLEELFPVGPASEDRHSEMSAVSSEDFKINVMTLDDLVPAEHGFTNDTAGKEKEAKLSSPDPGSLNRRQVLRSKEKQKTEEQRQEKEDVLDYPSDFESENRTVPDFSASQVSEHLQGHGDEKELVSEVREEAEYDYSSTFSDTSCSSTLRTSDGSQTLSRSSDSRSFVSHNGESRRRASTRMVLKEAAVQTQSDPLASTRPAGLSALSPAVAMAYMDPSPVVTHTLSAEMVEALSTFNPAVFALNELLKQQLATTRRFIESSRHLHSSLVKSLEPPNYRYTTLEDTKKYILKRRPPKLTVEEALEEALQELRDHHHI